MWKEIKKGVKEFLESDEVQEFIKALPKILVCSVIIIAIGVGIVALSHYTEEAFEKVMEEHPEVLEQTTQMGEQTTSGTIPQFSLWWFVLFVVFISVVTPLAFYGGLYGSGCIVDPIAATLWLIPLVVSVYLLGAVGAVIIGVFACVAFFMGMDYVIKMHAEMWK